MSTNSSISRVLNKILVSLTSNITLLIQPKPLKKGSLNTRLGSSDKQGLDYFKEESLQGYIHNPKLYTT